MSRADRGRRRAEAARRFELAAPILRGALARAADGGTVPHRTVLLHLADDETLDFVDAAEGRALALTPPLTSDHLIRCKPSPMWLDPPGWEDGAKLRARIEKGVAAFVSAYEAYFGRNARRHASGLAMLDPLPRVVLMPGLGAICTGSDAKAAGIVRDITRHTLDVKTRVARFAQATRTGGYLGLSEDLLFDMEYRGMQQAKLAGPTGSATDLSLAGHVSLVTGAAGAIGSGICRELLGQGSHVVATDLPGAALEGLVAELAPEAGGRITGVAMDVTDPRSVAQGIAATVRAFGGLDLVVVNAGIAHVSTLATMDLEEFRRLERVNVEGALLVISEAARLFERQGMGGDIVLISTKNVFAPGAGFGAYSATKAAAHQLARIASLELAPAGIRVNMVAPDAVFAEGGRKSGLWAEVGPERMRARGLDEKGLEEYYRNRNLLKTSVTARHVAKAVLFFATRQTPTTGATIPVDGGLPDATPR